MDRVYASRYIPGGSQLPLISPSLSASQGQQLVVAAEGALDGVLEDAAAEASAVGEDMEADDAGVEARADGEGMDIEPDDAAAETAEVVAHAPAEPAAAAGRTAPGAGGAVPRMLWLQLQQLKRLHQPQVEPRQLQQS